MEPALDVLRLALAIERLMKDKSCFLHGEKAPAAIGLTSSTQMLVLATLQLASGPTWERTVGLTPTEISASIGCGRSTVAMQIRELLKGKFVELAEPGARAHSGIDGRERRYHLTPLGSNAAEVVHERADQLRRAMVMHLPAKTAEEWFKSLRALLCAMSPNDANVSFEAIMRTAVVSRRERRHEK